MDKKVKTIFDDVKNGIAEFDTSTQSVFETYKRNQEAARISASRFKDEEREYKNLMSGHLATARAALESADKQFASRVAKSIQQLRRILVDRVTESADPAFLANLRLYEDFGLKMSLTEAKALASGSMGNYTALRCLRSTAAKSGFDVTFPTVDAFEADIAALEKLTRRPTCYSPISHLSEAQEIFPQRPFFREDGTVMYNTPSDAVFFITNHSRFESAWKNIEEIAMRWESSFVPRISELKTEVDPETNEEITPGRQRAAAIKDTVRHIEIERHDDSAQKAEKKAHEIGVKSKNDAQNAMEGIKRFMK